MHFLTLVIRPLRMECDALCIKKNVFVIAVQEEIYRSISNGSLKVPGGGTTFRFASINEKNLGWKQEDSKKFPTICSTKSSYGTWGQAEIMLGLSSIVSRGDTVQCGCVQATPLTQCRSGQLVSMSLRAGSSSPSRLTL